MLSEHKSLEFKVCHGTVTFFFLMLLVFATVNVLLVSGIKAQPRQSTPSYDQSNNENEASTGFLTESLIHGQRSIELNGTLSEDKQLITINRVWLSRKTKLARRWENGATWAIAKNNKWIVIPKQSAATKAKLKTKKNPTGSQYSYSNPQVEGSEAVPPGLLRALKANLEEDEYDSNPEPTTASNSPPSGLLDSLKKASPKPTTASNSPPSGLLDSLKEISNKSRFLVPRGLLKSLNNNAVYRKSVQQVKPSDRKTPATKNSQPPPSGLLKSLSTQPKKKGL